MSEVENFSLDKPKLVCRWRLAGGKLPLVGRHMRALRKRELIGSIVTTQLMAWAKQHIEWTLSKDSSSEPDGVLMLIVDQKGKAAMSIGAFEKLSNCELSHLLDRALLSKKEASETGVAPEVMVVKKGERVFVLAESQDKAAGAASLVCDLAKAHGYVVEFDADMLDEMLDEMQSFDEYVFVSDEYGVVLPDEAEFVGEFGKQLVEDYQKLLEETSK